jgi:hypothetical protein
MLYNVVETFLNDAIDVYLELFRKPTLNRNGYDCEVDA